MTTHATSTPATSESTHLAESKIDWASLAQAALRARERSYAPYSNFAVGAALLTATGEVVTGANVENRSYPVTICAERSAVARANAQGEREFVAIAIAADNQPPARPCGLCLETLAEFCDDLPILLVNTAGDTERVCLRDLLPRPFRFSSESTVRQSDDS